MKAGTPYLKIRTFLHIASIFLLAACTSNQGWYYEVKRAPSGGCLTLERSESKRGRSGHQICGLSPGKRYQVDGFSRVLGEKDPRPPLERLLVEIPAFAGGGIDTIPARILLPYGDFVRGSPRYRHKDSEGPIALLHIAGGIALLLLTQTRIPLLIILQPLIQVIWAVLVVSVAKSHLDMPRVSILDAAIPVSVLAAVLILIFLPKITQDLLGVGLTEACLQAYFSLRGVDALEARRQQYRVEQEERKMEEERRKMEEEAQRLNREEQQLLAEMRDSSGSPQEFFEMLESVPQDLEQFHGYVEEVKRRWIEKQLQKSVDATRERIQATASLYATYADLQRRKAEMVRAYEAFKRVHQDVEIDTLEQEVKRAELETKKAVLATERARAEVEHKALVGATAAGALPAALGVTIGRTEDAAGNPKSISLSPFLRRQHCYILGKTQTGKTTLLQNLVRQDMAQGNGCAFIDPHGDAVLKLLAYVPERRIEDVVYLDFTDTSPVVAFNLLAAPADQRSGIVEDFLSYFNRFFGTDPTTAPRMLDILRYALLTLLHSRSPKTIADLRRLLMDPQFREEVLQEITHSELIAFWKQRFPNFPKGAAEPILTRLSAFLAPGSPLRPILTQPENRVDFSQILNEGKILLARLSKGRGLEEATHFLGALLITRIQQEALARTEIPQERRRPFFLYVDEFQNYTVNSFETILAEAAKYRLSVTMANQNLHQLPASLRSAILGNVATIIAFRIGSEDAPVIQREIRKPAERPGYTPTGTPTMEKGWFPEIGDLQNLRPYEAFVRLGRPELVERVKTFSLPPPAPNASEIRREVRAWSQRRYYGEPPAERARDEAQRVPPSGPEGFLE